MAEGNKEASQRWRGQVRDVLNTVWDPIGGCPEDEYDSYVGKIASLVREGRPDRELLAYLEWAETVNMGMRGDADRRQKTVATVRAIGPPP